MATIPPTTTEVDTWLTGQQGVNQWLGQALQTPGTQILGVILAYTRNDGTKIFEQIPRPDQDGPTAAMLTGLKALYGAITIRVYQFTYTSLTPAQLASPQATQDFANNSANWAIP